ncbi:MAG: hypothetical protein ABIO95_01685 [Bdellovibrionota bacterium]
MSQMMMKTSKLFSVLVAIFACAASFSCRSASNESFPILAPKDLGPKLESGTKTLKSALGVQKKTSNAHVEARGEYFSWLSQCIDVIAKDEASPLWDPCLRFAAQLLRVETSGETATQLILPYKKFRLKWVDTLKHMEDADRLFLNQEAEGAVTMSSDED